LGARFGKFRDEPGKVVDVIRVIDVFEELSWIVLEFAAYLGREFFKDLATVSQGVLSLEEIEVREVAIVGAVFFQVRETAFSGGFL
jgi:hypothetical protein